MKNSLPIVITTGDYNGIGPEIITKALTKIPQKADKIIIAGDKRLYPQSITDRYRFIEVPMTTELIYGKETKESGEFSFQCLKKACELAKNNKISGIVTAPVSKNALHLAGHNFSGQTEVIETLLAENGQKAEMLFVAKDFRVLLLTRHIALKDVKITRNLILEKVKRLNTVLKRDFQIASPKLALCALNPHAGENGILGKEEITEIKPAIKELKERGIDITDPMPADTLFVSAARAILENKLQQYDCYIACYHDQGLIPMKVLAMDAAVNMTIGLNIIRTSPAHGTAYDIAGQNIADESSMSAAISHFI